MFGVERNIEIIPGVDWPVHFEAEWFPTFTDVGSTEEFERELRESFIQRGL
jgi:hypothetical protein